MGTVADFGPIPKPRESRAMNMDHHALVNPCQKQARAENIQVMKIVPRRPNQLLNGMVSQHPIIEHPRYGAEFRRPSNQVSREDLPPIPNCAP